MSMLRKLLLLVVAAFAAQALADPATQAGPGLFTQDPCPVIKGNH